jgi:hypothetical protein
MSDDKKAGPKIPSAEDAAVIKTLAKLGATMPFWFALGVAGGLLVLGFTADAVGPSIQRWGGYISAALAGAIFLYWGVARIAMNFLKKEGNGEGNHA